MAAHDITITKLEADIRGIRAAMATLSEEAVQLRSHVKEMLDGVEQGHQLLLDVADKLDGLSSEHNTVRDASLLAFKDLHRHIVALLHDGTHAAERLRVLEAHIFPAYSSTARQIAGIIGEVPPRDDSEKFDRRD